MFSNLLQFWQGKDFLTQVLEEFKTMLDDAHIMFESVCRKIIANQDEPEIENKIYAVDAKINALQKDIRKKIITHLSIQPSVDMPVSLILMSVVKDAERLGDYAKNLLEINTLLQNPIDQQKYAKIFNNIDQKILQLFKKTKSAFLESDETKATQSWESEKKIVKFCDEIITNLSKSSLSVNEAVCFTLIARYFKRIAAHLTNIATSVVLPLSDLDYFDEKIRDNINEK
ncbi:MAG: hypothetical protein DRP78_00535 [Candidatus Omnitrophota bacterium]|nr:MAG: hypothetical protein DRP78_00535 [Candidatus Omnitrophota bacterium]